MNNRAIIHAWDHVGTENFQRAMEKYSEYGLNNIVYYETPQEVVQGADVCFIFIE